MIREVPPAGAPITLSAILNGVKSIFYSDSCLQEFENKIKAYLGAKHCFFVSSGRAALFIILKILRNNSTNRNVIIPGYTCYTVAATVAKAGLQVMPCDLSMATFDFDKKKLSNIDMDDTLCIIPTHLFGLPSSIDEIRNIVKRHNIPVIEDAAQAFGGEINGKKMGTIGDIGFFSLQRGKNLTTMEGGIIVTDSEKYASEITKEIANLSQLNFIETNEMIIKSFIYWIFLNPSLYWVPERLPFVNLGATEFSLEYPVKTFSDFQAGIGNKIVERLDEYNQIRKNNSKYLYTNISKDDHFIIPEAISGHTSAMIRFPVIFNDLQARDDIFNSLQNLGIGCSKMYPSAINSIPGISQYLSKDTGPLPVSKKIADGVLTLPIHPLVTTNDLDRIIELFNN